MGETAMIRKSIKNFLAASAFVASAAPAYANSFGVDVMDGSTTADLKVGAQIPETPLKFFSRVRITADNHGGTKSLFLADLIYRIPSGLGVVLEGFSLRGEYSTKVGPQFLGSLAGIDKVFVWPGAVLGHGNPAFHMKADASKTVSAGPVDLDLSFETLTTYDGDSVSSTQRLRPGINIGSYTVGPALDLSESTKDRKVSYSGGVFGKVDF